MSAKKNMGRVKHYRHSFYTGPQRVKRVLAVVLGLALLFALGWLIGPHVIDFGTRTWYSLKNGGASQPPQSQSQPAALPQATPQPTPQPTPEPPQVESGGWSFVSLSSIDTAEKAAATAQELAQQGVKYAVVTLKDEQGYIYYASAVESAAQSVAATTIDAAAAAQAFKDAGLVPVAQLCAFQDPKAPYADRTMGVYYQDSDYFWLDAASDAGGKPWLNPYSDRAVAFVGGLISEVRGLGYQQILMTGVQFPNTDGSNANYRGQDGTSKPDRLAQLIGRWQAEAEEAGGVLWVEYTLAQASGQQPTALGGGTLGQLGVQNLVLRLGQTDDPEAQEAQLATARGQAREGGAQHIVLRQGTSAGFDDLDD